MSCMHVIVVIRNNRHITLHCISFSFSIIIKSIILELQTVITIINIRHMHKVFFLFIKFIKSHHRITLILIRCMHIVFFSLAATHNSYNINSLDSIYYLHIFIKIEWNLNDVFTKRPSINYHHDCVCHFGRLYDLLHYIWSKFDLK